MTLEDCSDILLEMLTKGLKLEVGENQNFPRRERCELRVSTEKTRKNQAGSLKPEDRI
jgi:hypothetical protein